MHSIGKAMLIGFMFPIIANAQQTNTVDSLKTDQLSEVEITGSFASQKAPFSVTNYSQKKIKEQNIGQDLPYLLNQTPSVIINSDAGNGIGYTSLRIRGTDAQRINFTINGVPVNDAESQGTFFVNFPDLISSAGSMQIQRGVGSSTNGTGAFGGSVHISTLLQTPTPTLELLNSYGSFNTFRNTLKLGTGLLNNGFQFDVRLSKISSDGYIQRAASNLKAAQILGSWTSKNQLSKIRANIFTGIQQTGQAWNGIDDEQLKKDRTYNPLGLMPNGQFYTNQTDNYQQDYYQLFWDQKIKNWSLNIGLFLTRGKGFYDEFREEDDYEDYGLPNLIRDTDTIHTTDLTRQLWLDNYNYGAIYNARYSTDKTDLVIGGNIINYEGDHFGKVTWAANGAPANYEWYRLHSAKADINIFSKWTQAIGKNLFATLDLQYRHVHYQTAGFRKNPTLAKDVRYNFFNPKVGLLHQKSWNDKMIKSFISFAVANKEPNRNDFENFQINPLHEQLYDAELGYQYSSKKLNIELNFYYMYYINQLINDGKINDVGAYTRINAPKSYRIGQEIALNYKAANWLHLHAGGTISNNTIIDFTEYIDNYDTYLQEVVKHGNTPIAFSPNLIMQAGITLQPLTQIKKPLFVDIFYKHISRQYLDNTGNKASSLNPYGLVDLKVRYTLNDSRKNTQVDFFIAVNNILNKKYEANGYAFSYILGGEQFRSNYYFPQAGTNFMIGCNFKLSK